MEIKRVFLLVLDSVGIGASPDAAQYGDAGSHTLRSCWQTGKLHLPHLKQLGLYNIEGIGCGEPVAQPIGAFARLREQSAGKDTTIGHWEIAGIVSPTPLPTYPNGFPPEVIAAFCRQTGRGILCNQPYSGTQVIADYGNEHLRTGDLIVYTSADSVFQIAAHEEIVPVEQLYAYCRIAREILQGEHGVGRVIARPFTGNHPFTRTPRRHDFSLAPPPHTVLDHLQAAGLDTIAIGKIQDIFAGRGISAHTYTSGNDDGMAQTIRYAGEHWSGLCFANLVDFDMLYGHRNDIDGYTQALNRCDQHIGELLSLLREEDVLMITADHGCDPATPSTDHSREYTPWLIYGKAIQPTNLGTLPTFACIGATICGLFHLPFPPFGTDLCPTILRAP